MLDGNYNRKCKSSLGGVKAIWLLKWKPYTRSQISVSGNIITSFPESFVYKFESLTIPNASENQTTNEGGKFYEQSISLNFKADTANEVQKLIDNDYRVLFLDNNGLYRIYGLWNGMQCDSVDFNTGGVKSDFNGYNFTLKGLEERESLFITNPFNNTYYILTMNNDYLTNMNNERLKYR